MTETHDTAAAKIIALLAAVSESNAEARDGLTVATLAPGDLMCLFTDGLVETRAATEMFGSERVAARLAAQRGHPVESIASGLVDLARGFHGGDLEDDLALLLIRVPPSTSQTEPDRGDTEPSRNS